MFGSLVCCVGVLLVLIWFWVVVVGWLVVFWVGGFWFVGIFVVCLVCFGLVRGFGGVGGWVCWFVFVVGGVVGCVLG